MGYRRKTKTYTGDCDLIIDGYKTGKSLIFKNNGNVTINNGSPGKYMRFENTGNVILNYGGAKHNASKYTYKNIGNVDIFGFPSISTFHVFKNKGYVNIHGKPLIGKSKFRFSNEGAVCLDVNEIPDNMVFYNIGGFITSAKYIKSGVEFHNVGEARFPMVSHISSDVLFINKGSVYFTSDSVELSTKVIFRNNRHVYITNLKSLSVAPTFSNSGNVCIGGVKQLIRWKLTTKDMLVFNNYGSVILYDLKYISYPNLKFNNKGNVNIPQLEEIASGIEFNNIGTVHLESVKALSNNNISFNNSKDVYLSSLDENTKKYITFNCGGNLHITNLTDEMKKHINCGGYVFMDDKTVYSGDSFLTRYNVDIKDRKVILYKCVNREYKAPYDENDITYLPGEEIRIDDWNPYDKECGRGKIVAASTPTNSMVVGSKTTTKYIAISVNVFDLFEWTCVPKYPQIIGFNKCTVLYECDINGNKITI